MVVALRLRVVGHVVGAFETAREDLDPLEDRARLRVDLVQRRLLGDADEERVAVRRRDGGRRQRRLALRRQVREPDTTSWRTGGDTPTSYLTTVPGPAPVASAGASVTKTASPRTSTPVIDHAGDRLGLVEHGTGLPRRTG